MTKRQNDYAQKLKDPKWQKRRLEMLEIANWQCNVCHDEEEELHIHHIEYFQGRDPWEYSDDQMICLCKTCHTLIHLCENKVKLFSDKFLYKNRNDLASDISVEEIKRIKPYGGHGEPVYEVCCGILVFHQDGYDHRVRGVLEKYFYGNNIKPIVIGYDRGRIEMLWKTERQSLDNGLADYAEPDGDSWCASHYNSETALEH